MKRRIHRAILAVAVLTLLMSLLVVTGVLYQQITVAQRERLETQLALVAHSMEQTDGTFLENLPDSNSRITWVDAQGAVRFDSDADVDEMDNHLAREEIRQALQSGDGASERYSHTLAQTMLYHARRLSDGSVVRVAVGYDSALMVLTKMLVPMIAVFLVAAAVSGLCARRMAQRIAQPINELDLEHPDRNETYDELSPILTRLNRQRRQLDEQMALLRRKADEFDQVVTSLAEGMVLLDGGGNVVSMNPAARRIFGAPDGIEGQNFLTVDRNPLMSRTVQAALAGERGGFAAARAGSEYQFNVSPIRSQGQTLGAVILAIDVTEQALAQKRRQSFTANVSHELKTPLQSILGSAELMENGLVRAEDTPRFVGHIRNEAQRLLTLINDILRLSQMDEDTPLEREAVELLSLAREACDELSPIAQRRGVSLRVEGQPVCVNGVRQYLYEIVHNLCDNAIRYNVEGGSVSVRVHDEAGHAVLTVKDTGIGIAPEHQSRVFERFYRVDKSHSKQTGGTGLGLSIVKHAVQYHGGRLEMESAIGQGTQVRVVF